MHLRDAHFALAGFCMMIRAQSIRALQMVLGRDVPAMPDLPLRMKRQVGVGNGTDTLPDSILDATSYRALMSAILEHADKAIASFDQLFGERA